MPPSSQKKTVQSSTIMKLTGDFRDLHFFGPKKVRFVAIDKDSVDPTQGTKPPSRLTSVLVFLWQLKAHEANMKTVSFNCVIYVTNGRGKLKKKITPRVREC